MEIKLSKPLLRDGQTVETLKLDMNELKGADLVQAEREARLRGDISTDPLFSSEGLSIVAAKVSGVLPEDIQQLAAPDFLMVMNTVKNFLYGWVLPTNSPSET
ncbi:phage tail assembly protein [Brevibacillus ruminantium]|uniref:Phage tail assembly protein n=1 Tax=Brevibacillus ruminantium TaxID=2950604 RepID=A0ABY4WKR4_9BACL|nr:phage tail assembly protein [Brevibacillus ruminantium]USG67449.1 phage tail assembly protein [Brevibacillus ruminantium]